MDIHNGHRERLRNRFIEQGLKGFEDVNALELLLFYAIPRKDTNPIAHALLERFGSLDAVFETSVKELAQVPGVGESAAVLINMLPQMMQKVMVSKTKNTHILKDYKTAGEYLQPRFMYEREEIILLVCLDSRKRIINCTEISRGVVNYVAASARKIVECAVLNRADSVIIAHNHPNGLPIPSVEDRAATAQIRQSLAAVDISLADHFVITDDEYVSMASMNLMG